MRRALAVVVALLAVAALGGCRLPWQCPLTDDARPSCGGVVLGVTTAQPSTEMLSAAEDFVGRPYDMVYRFHEIDDAFPTDEERGIVASGRLLHLSVDTRVEDSRDGLSWAAVAAGRHDAELSAQGRAIADLHSPVLVTYEHEMDQASKSALGTPEEFVAAWRHVHDVYTRAGATNVVWVWVASGTTPTLERASVMWPGNDVVDWISWDVYNAAGCRADRTSAERHVSFEESFSVFHDWLEREGPGLGIDVTKPKMLSETGSVVYPDDPSLTAQWYSEMPDVLRRHPDVVAVGLWDHVGIQSCDYRFTGVASLEGAMRGLARSDVFAELDVSF
ncbi:glycoside hydrolase family 26 protein [Phycicoccus sonneratiae]|uniref:GH26 domain-containing protein n=1 Tax=Phycicoccus sonneratiae TaxID=2807628 RepID=A0ABS2CQB6_9MICO|nr:hypothetical protein [Phycicoccus sonneraticus]MBM6402078.1 hypothetical protein [Phycicoccus sonneraticus]